MARAAKITRAPLADYGPIHVKREGKADLLIDRGRLLLTVETVPVEKKPIGPKRWRVYRLFENETHTVAVVSEEGHSSSQDERVRFDATVCRNGADVYEAMGRIEELKPVLAEVQWPAVEVI